MLNFYVLTTENKLHDEEKKYILNLIEVLLWANLSQNLYNVMWI